VPAAPGRRAVLVLLPIRSVRWRIQGPWARTPLRGALTFPGALPVRSAARHLRATGSAAGAPVTRAG